MRSWVSVSTPVTHGPFGIFSHIHVISKTFKDTQSASEHVKNGDEGNSVSDGGHLFPMSSFLL